MLKSFYPEYKHFTWTDPGPNVLGGRRAGDSRKNRKITEDEKDGAVVLTPLGGVSLHALSASRPDPASPASIDIWPTSP